MKEMNVLITGANGFAGRNLCASLAALRDGKDRTRPALKIGEILTYDTDTDPASLPALCERADWIFHLAGVNRPTDPSEFRTGNADLTARLCDILRTLGVSAEQPKPLVLSSSVQATLTGRYADSPYGLSKRDAEDACFALGRSTGSPVYVYRLPNLFGKWCRPNYNSVVATFCHNLARDLPITVSDPDVGLELAYIDDVISAWLDLMEGTTARCRFDDDGTCVPDPSGPFCRVPTTHRVTLGRLVTLLTAYRDQPATLTMPDIPAGSLEKKLYSTYLSYLPPEKAAFPLKVNADARGSFTELLRTQSAGQFSVNVSKPGVTKGQHWHHTKWEFFIVVSGEALIEERCLGSDEVLRFRVSGDRPTAVHMLPGYTHNIINLSDTRDLVTLMWANEPFDPAHPDTFFEKV